MHCHYDNDEVFTKVNIHRLLKMRGKGDQVPGRSQCLLLGYQNLPRIPATWRTSFINYRSTTVY